MSKQRGLTQSRLRALLHYDPDTGVWTWLARSAPGSHVRVGDTAGTVHKGYLRIKIECELYMAHCLAWLYMTGKWPQSEVDHRDCVPENIRWSNLRLASPRQNMGNKRVRSICGLKGVTQLPSGNWRATIKSETGQVHLGTFGCPDEAHAAYRAAADKLYGEFARYA